MRAARRMANVAASEGFNPGEASFAAARATVMITNPLMTKKISTPALPNRAGPCSACSNALSGCLFACPRIACIATTMKAAMARMACRLAMNGRARPACSLDGSPTAAGYTAGGRRFHASLGLLHRGCLRKLAQPPPRLSRVGQTPAVSRRDRSGLVADHGVQGAGARAQYRDA